MSYYSEVTFPNAICSASIAVLNMTNTQLIDEYFKDDDAYVDEHIAWEVKEIVLREMKRRDFDFTWLEEYKRLEREQNKVLQKADGRGEVKWTQADGIVFRNKALNDEFHKLEELQKEAISNWKIAVMEDGASEGD